MLRIIKENLLVACSLIAVGTVLSAVDAHAQEAQPQTPPPSQPGSKDAPSAAQPNAEPSSATDAMGDIVVTAQRRSESVQRIPIAITALEGQGLQDRGQTSVSQIATQVPNLFVGEQVGQARVTLRGIGLEATSTAVDGSVALNVDGIYYSRTATALASFYDLERVEVLRGPQGTLYGRNAAAGAVNLLPARPTDSLSGYIKATYGNYDALNTEGAIGGRIVDGVKARLSFQTQKRDGYGRNIVTGSDIDNKDSRAVRGQISLEPASNLEIRLSGDYYHSSDRSGFNHFFLVGAGRTAVGVPIVPNAIRLGSILPTNIRDIAANPDPSSRQTFYGFSSHITWNVGQATIRSITAWRHSAYTVDSELSGGSLPLARSIVREKAEQFSQELQAGFESESNKLVFGVYYFRESDEGANFLGLNAINFNRPVPILLQGFASAGTLKTRAGAIFGQDTYSVTDRLRLTLGARYSIEKKIVQDQRAPLDLTRPFSVNNPILAPVRNEDTTFRSFTPRIGVDFDLAQSALLFASYSKGFKSGTYSLGAGLPPVRPEKVSAYEIGLKSTLFDRRLRANLTGFYYDYRDLQTGRVRESALVIENAANARIYGMEGEFVLRPILAPLTLSLNAAYLHARFTDYLTSDAARVGGDGRTTIDPVTQTKVPAGTPGAVNGFDLKGNTLSRSPKYTINLAAEYTWDLAGGKLSVRGESAWTGRVYFSPFNVDEVSQPAYNLLNAYVNYDLANGLSAQMYIKNIRNRTIYASANVSTAVIGSPVNGILMPPRTYGGSVTYRF